MTAEKSSAEESATETFAPEKSEWWRSAVIYQIYPRSFADASGDGMGDLQGITSRLPAVKNLGADAVWLSPFYTSPQRDAGYDVADYCGVDPRFGTIADFDALTRTAHELGLRVIVDIVPNHSSSDHVWFQEALASGEGSAERARYIFRDGKGETGEIAPNNWKSVFGGPAWSRLVNDDGNPGQWYLHLFDSSQPDFDWTNPWVHEQFRNVLRFWLDRGVDGFRVDVAHGMVKAEGLPDYTPPAEGGSMGGGAPGLAGAGDGGRAETSAGSTSASAVSTTTGSIALEPQISSHEDNPPTPPYWAQDGVHAIYREWRSIIDQYPGDRVLVAEAWVEPLSKLALWVRPDEMHQAFNFAYLETGWSAPALRQVIDASLVTFTGVGAPSTWVLSNHDVVRHASRLALTTENLQGHGIGPNTKGLPDEQLGARRARAATSVMLGLPGSAYLYQGEELGLPEVINLPDEAREDPTWFRTNGERYGRDGCRVPIPWEADSPSYGFSSGGESWLPQPDDWAKYARDSQLGVPGSTLELYRHMLQLRDQHSLGLGSLAWVRGFPSDVVAYVNGSIKVISNLGDRPVELPVGEVILASEPVSGAILPPATTVWMLA